MSPAPARARRRVCGVLAAGLVAGLAVAGLAACGPASPPTAGPVASATLGPASSAGPVAVTSPVVGLLVRLDATGLTKITGFRLRTADGTELELRLGVLENGAEFPPGHLAEHMSTSSAVRVFFRDEAGEHVVYRVEDAE